MSVAAVRFAGENSIKIVAGNSGILVDVAGITSAQDHTLAKRSISGKEKWDSACVGKINASVGITGLFMRISAPSMKAVMNRRNMAEIKSRFPEIERYAEVVRF